MPAPPSDISAFHLVPSCLQGQTYPIPPIFGIFLRLLGLIPICFIILFHIPMTLHELFGLIKVLDKNLLTTTNVFPEPAALRRRRQIYSTVSRFSGVIEDTMARCEQSGAHPPSYFEGQVY